MLGTGDLAVTQTNMNFSVKDLNCLVTGLKKHIVNVNEWQQVSRIKERNMMLSKVYDKWI